MEGPAFYLHAQEGYDALAPTYDAEIGANPIGHRMRMAFRHALSQAFNPGNLVFEIGSGSGIDALWLARQGIRVVATDLSGAMVAIAAAKAQEEGLEDFVVCRRLAASEIGALAQEFGEGTFDGGFCHAGALNMEPDLLRVPAQVHALLKPGHHFVCSVVNKASLFEILFYPTVLKPRKAFRRLGKVVPLPISRQSPLNRHVIPTRFYSPGDLAGIFGPAFQVESIRGLQILLPPANLAEEYVKLRPLFKPLARLEEWIAERPPFRSWGHHSLLVLRGA